MSDSLGLYLSVPFCRAKCSFCNFASGVFAAERMVAYVGQLCAEMREVQEFAAGLGAAVPGRVDTVYFGGGTPSLLEPETIGRVFAGLRAEFTLEESAEVTVECAPGQLSQDSLDAFLRAGVNRLSFGVQSFVDAEAAAVGRLHTGASCRDELRRVAAAGVQRIGVDLIVGLPGQTEHSWRYTVEQALESGVEHVSVYMLEVDEGSRLGREALRGGSRYGAGSLPEDDRVADWYSAGCEWLEAAGVRQYEISNFARPGAQSRHNRKYWERAPYLGFGLDAHSMLRVGSGGVRWSNGDEMDGFVQLGGSGSRTVERVTPEQGFEEALFLGLRLVEGVSLASLQQQFGALVHLVEEGIDECRQAGLTEREGDRVRLTTRGRMASNEVFGRLLAGALI